MGGTSIKIHGFGFKPFNERIDSKDGQPANKLFIRYLDSQTGAVISKPRKLEQGDYTNELIMILSDPHPMGTKALIQISLNNDDWINVKPPQGEFSFVYYESPHITGIKPSFGPLKSRSQKTMTISGTNFVC